MLINGDQTTNGKNLRCLYLLNPRGLFYGECVQIDLAIHPESSRKFICQSTSCYTNSGKACVFPFKYAGRTYSQCITIDNNDVPWCSTGVDDQGHYVKDYWGNCQADCNYNNCPVGYVRAFPDTTCYRIASFKERVKSFDEAENVCQNDGGRLWQPRVSGSFSNIRSLEMDTLSYNALFAIGIKFDPYSGNYTYRNGEEVDEGLFPTLPFRSNEFTSSGGQLCVALESSQLIITPCKQEEDSVIPLYFICESRPDEYIDEKLITYGGDYKVQGRPCVLPFLMNEKYIGIISYFTFLLHIEPF